MNNSLLTAYRHAIAWAHYQGRADKDYYIVERTLQKAMEAEHFKASLRSNIKNYLGVFIGLIVFLFITCGIAEYIVIKLIGG